MTYQAPIELEPNMVPGHLKRAYSGRKFKAVVTDSVTIHADAGTWSGGSREVFSAIRLDNGESVSITDTMSAWG